MHKKCIWGVYEQKNIKYVLKNEQMSKILKHMSKKLSPYLKFNNIW